MTNGNAAFTALWHPFLTGAIGWSESYLFLRARSGPIPVEIRPEQLECQQSFKPYADELKRTGWSTPGNLEKTYAIVLVLPPPQRDEARALFVRAMQQVREDGLVVVSMENSEGAKSGEKDLRALAPNIHSISKNKCRVFWASKKDVDENLMQSWGLLDVPRMIETTGFISRPGIFAWNRIDDASSLLTEYLPKDLSGSGADLGAGFGFLTHAILTQCENIKSMDVFEAEARALECARLNLAGFEKAVRIDYHWHDVAEGVQGPYDFVISNPPFHQGHDELKTLGQSFIESAARALKPGGRFYMVANRHLPYEATLKNNFSKTNVLAMKNGFKVFASIK